MPNQKTNEFSICLAPSSDLSNEIIKMRSKLPSSPYRDDPPHMTLIRGIVSEKSMTDYELIDIVSKLTKISYELPINTEVTDVVNKKSQFYSNSARLELKENRELLTLRQEMLEGLKSNGFTDVSKDKNNYDMRITVRLGIELDPAMLTNARKVFVGRQVTFTDWFILRLELNNGARKMHLVDPTTF